MPVQETAPAAQLREPVDTRPIPNWAIRNVGRERWVATYEGSPHSELQQGRRRVGLLVPRPDKHNVLGRSQIAFAYDGTLMEFPIGMLPCGSHGAWWTAHASELPREQWQAIRNFYINISQSS